MVILTKDNFKFGVAGGSKRSVNENGWDTQLSETSKNGVANSAVTREWNRLYSEKGKVNVQMPYYAGYSLKKPVEGLGTAFTPTSRSIFAGQKATIESSISSSQNAFSNAVKPDGTAIDSRNITAGSHLQKWASTGPGGISEIDFRCNKLFDEPQTFSDTYNFRSETRYPALQHRYFYNTYGDQYYTHVTGNEHVIKNDLPSFENINTDAMSCIQAILIIDEDWYVDPGESADYILDWGNGRIQGELCLSNGRLWTGSNLRNSSGASPYYTTTLSATTTAGYNGYTNSNADWLFLSKGVYSLTYYNEWRFSDESCIINTPIYISNSNGIPYYSGNMKVWGNGYVETFFWTRAYRTSNNNKMYVQKNNWLPETCPTAQMGFNSDTSSSSSNQAYTLTECFSSTLASSTTVSNIMGTACNLRASEPGTTQCWNYINSGNGIQDWFRRAYLEH